MQVAGTTLQRRRIKDALYQVIPVAITKLAHFAKLAVSPL